MGVSLPWAMSAALDARSPSSISHAWSALPPAMAAKVSGSLDVVNGAGGAEPDACAPKERILSLSGDGGFLFCAHELETAVRLGLDLVHVVWVDGTYNMVKVGQTWSK